MAGLTSGVHPLPAVRQARAAAGRSYHEFLRCPSLSTGLYRLAAGAEDPQRPHDEDEIYVVVAGAATFRVDGQDHPVTAGDTIFVAADVEHRFHTITEDLEVIVVFAPAETG